MSSVTLVEPYHALIDLEYEKYSAGGEDLSKAKFSKSEAVRQFTVKLGINLSEAEATFERLLNSGFIVAIGENSFRTLHFDLAYRISNIRVAYDSIRYPLEAKVYIKDEGMPNFSAIPFEQLEEILPKEIYTILEESLKKAGKHGEKIEGLSVFQWEAVRKIVSKDRKGYVLTAGTATGKTYAFLLPALIAILKAKQSSKNIGTKVLLVYPRKSLERDQLNKILSILYRVNTYLEKKGSKNKITVGIDDGPTPWKKDVVDGSSFRSAICSACGKSGFEGGELTYFARHGETIIRCKHCGTLYDWVYGVREQVWDKKPDILITNVWTLDFRLPSKTIGSEYKVFEDIEFVVLDEAHVYQSLLGGNIRYLLKRLQLATSQTPIIVLSSATIPYPSSFARQLLDLKEQQFEIIKPEEAERKKRTLYLILAVHPERSWETVVYELAILLGALHKYRKAQSVIFIDSKRELYRVYNQGFVAALRFKEPKDHFDKSLYADDPYAYWPYMTNGKEQFLNEKTPQEIFSKIQVHHADVKNREQLELDFTHGKLGCLISTSTLELGVDYPEVSVVVNVGIPFLLESIPQRMGRAGRDEKKTLNTILGVIVLRNTPLELYYLYNWKDLVEGFSKRETPIAWRNVSVKRYHALFAVVDEMARKGEETYILRTDGSLSDPEQFVNNILDYIDKEKTTVSKLNPQSEFDTPTPVDVLADVKKELSKLPTKTDDLYQFHSATFETHETVRHMKSALYMARYAARKMVNDKETAELADKGIKDIRRLFNV